MLFHKALSSALDQAGAMAIEGVAYLSPSAKGAAFLLRCLVHTAVGRLGCAGGLNVHLELGFCNTCLSCVRHQASLWPLLCFLVLTKQCKSTTAAHYTSLTQA